MVATSSLFAFFLLAASAFSAPVAQPPSAYTEEHHIQGHHFACIPLKQRIALSKLTDDDYRNINSLPIEDQKKVGTAIINYANERLSHCHEIIDGTAKPKMLGKRISFMTGLNIASLVPMLGPLVGKLLPEGVSDALTKIPIVGSLLKFILKREVVTQPTGTHVRLESAEPLRALLETHLGKNVALQ